MINPIAGIGGAVALKGSDTAEIQAEAIARGAQSKVADRCGIFLQGLRRDIEIVTAPAEMGEAVCTSNGLGARVVGSIHQGNTTSEDTKKMVLQFQAEAVDLIVFAGGDGTATDICQVVSEHQPVLGVPCGVKMHSGVFSISPAAASEIVNGLARGELTDVGRCEVRDLDESAFRDNLIRTRFEGEMLVPRAGRFVQAVKSAGREVEALVLEEIAADVIENMIPDVYYLIGSGKTTSAIEENLGFEGSLLGVDAVLNNELMTTDATESELLELADKYDIRIIVSVIGGQGHIFGRGNQQFSAPLLKKVGKQNVIVVSTKTKITGLDGRPLIVDTGDAELDRHFAGLIQVTTGYEDRILYPIGSVEVKPEPETERPRDSKTANRSQRKEDRGQGTAKQLTAKKKTGDR